MLLTPEFLELIGKAEPEQREWLRKALGSLQKSESTEEETTRISTPQMWVKLPAPPAPLGINHFPANPEVTIVGSQNLPNYILPYDSPIMMPHMQPSGAYSIGPAAIEVYNRVLSIKGKWERIVQGTATPEMSFKQTQTLRTGTSQSTSYEVGASLTLGFNFFASVEASISASFGQSFSFSEEKEVSQEFSLTSQKGPVSGCWWQGVYDCTHTYKVRYVNAPLDESINHPQYSNIPQFWLDMLSSYTDDSYTEKFVNRDKTFIPTQYPAPSSRSSLEPNTFHIEY